MKKVSLLALVAAFCLAACSNVGDTYVINNVVESGSQKEKSYSIKVANLALEYVDWRVYDEKAAGKVATYCQLPLGFKSGNKDLPYIPISKNLLDCFFIKGLFDVSKVKSDTKQVTMTNTITKATAVIDLLHRKIVFDNYDAFFQLKPDSVYADIAGIGANIDWLKMTSYGSIAGKPLTVYWGGSSNIEIVIWRLKDECALAFPLQTFCDIFCAPFLSTLYYNGTYLYNNLDNDQVAEEYYSAAPTGKRSKLLADFCYDELCFNLDLNYGLKAIHGIDNFKNFDEFFELVGIRDALKSEDSLTFSNAIKDVCEFYFADGHSIYDRNSWRLGKDVKVPGTKEAVFDKTYDENLKKYPYTARNQKYYGSTDPTDKRKPVPCYEVSADGKTAIVRFDIFTNINSNKTALIAQRESLDDAKMDVYAGDKVVENDVVTAAMISAVNEKIKANANIKNVVLDLSCNGGGSCRAAAFVLSWMLGECTFDLSNPVTGAKWTAKYRADVDFDGDYDARDTIKDKKLFCLISPVSFSCGSMVPAMLKASGSATILGVASSGGTSCVQSSSAADGTAFNFSSKTVMSVSKNGSTYNIDQGIEPHYYINKPKNFYDIETIAAMVKSINEGKL